MFLNHENVTISFCYCHCSHFIDGTTKSIENVADFGVTDDQYPFQGTFQCVPRQNK